MADFDGEPGLDLGRNGFLGDEDTLRAFQTDITDDIEEPTESKGSLATIWSKVSIVLLSIPAFFYGIVLSALTLFVVIALPNNQALSAAITVVCAVVLFGILFLQFKARGRVRMAEVNDLEDRYGDRVPL
nr:hypothetical protein [Sicyoidochytrium minutum DNA virus]